MHGPKRIFPSAELLGGLQPGRGDSVQAKEVEMNDDQEDQSIGLLGLGTAGLLGLQAGLAVVKGLSYFFNKAYVIEDEVQKDDFQNPTLLGVVSPKPFLPHAFRKFQCLDCDFCVL